MSRVNYKSGETYASVDVVEDRVGYRVVRAVRDVSFFFLVRSCAWMDEQLEGKGTGEDSTKHGVVLPEEETAGTLC